jgi:hypothetical protein
MRQSKKSVLFAKAAGLCGVVLLVAGWGSDPPAVAERLEVAEAAPAITAPVSEHSEFAIPAGMLDTWNAVGQILVRLDGVTYEGRAQMLGLYAVHYRGERILILTKARVLQNPTDTELTYVRALLQSGGPNNGTLANELIGHLEQRLPAELARIAAGEAGQQTAGLNPH